MTARLFSIPGFRFSIVDPASAVGKWSRVATFGPKSKDGADMVFDATTLGEMVDNAAARGDRIAICNDHASAYPETKDAPALGFFHALAVVEGGRVVKHWALDEGTPPDASTLADGLYARLGEITPRGADPLVGLANYRTLSPMFVTSGADEAGKPIGYALLDVGATNVPFQAGAEIMFHRMSAPQAQAVTMAYTVTIRYRGGSGNDRSGKGDDAYVGIVEQDQKVVDSIWGASEYEVRQKAQQAYPGVKELKMSAPAAQAVTMAIGFLIDGEGPPVSLDEMIRDNPDDAALIARLRAMRPGDVANVGGGAGAGFEIKAVMMSAAAQGAIKMAKDAGGTELYNGDKVRIESGPGAGNDGTVSFTDGNTVTVNCSVNGILRAIDVDARKVRKMSAPPAAAHKMANDEGFSVGDYVRTADGMAGYVVAADGQNATIDVGSSKIKRPYRDVRRHENTHRIGYSRALSRGALVEGRVIFARGGDVFLATAGGVRMAKRATVTMAVNYDCVYYWTGGKESGKWNKAIPDDGNVQGMIEQIKRQGYYALPGKSTIGPPEGPPRDPSWSPGSTNY